MQTLTKWMWFFCNSAYHCAVEHLCKRMLLKILTGYYDIVKPYIVFALSSMYNSNWWVLSGWNRYKSNRKRMILVPVLIQFIFLVIVVLCQVLIISFKNSKAQVFRGENSFLFPLYLDAPDLLYLTLMKRLILFIKRYGYNSENEILIWNLANNKFARFNAPRWHRREAE